MSKVVTSATVCADPLRVAVAIATAGRAAVLAEMLSLLQLQIRPPDKVLVCPAAPDDFDAKAASALGLNAIAVSGPTGLPAQRNALIEACEADVVVFFDDDFLPTPDFVEQAERLFHAYPEVVVATGNVLADGISTEGLDFDEGRRILERAGPNPGGAPVDTHNAYGCNMVIRLAPVLKHGIRFDEVLPLYGWQEDVDFSRQLAPYGRIVRSPNLRGVHLGTKRSGRSPGKRLGYSQIANPIYLARKGTLSWGRALTQMGRNFIANSAGVLRPEPWVDRRGRLAGNLLALRELLQNRLHPSRILEIL